MCRKARLGCYKVSFHSLSDTSLRYTNMGTARVSVQFQSVAEKLTPHDTVFAFSKSSELQEATLSSACSLHTASASINSKDSSPHRGLAGITEDSSESRTENDQGGRSPEGLRKSDVSIPRTPEDPQRRPEKVNARISAENSHDRSSSITTQTTYRPRTMSDTNKALPPPPEDYTLEDANSRSIRNYGDYNTRPSVDERYSSQSARPRARDLNDAYEYKSKVKLGPRPSMDSQRTPDGSHRQSDFRPIASLPAGLRMPSRKAVLGRPVSRQSQTTSPERISSKEMPPPPPKTPITPIQTPDHKLSVQSTGLPTPLKTPDSIAPKMTPEKRRLMKALQLRQKQLAAQKPVNGLGIEVSPEDQGPGVIKPELDNAVLSTMVCVESPRVKPDGVHVASSDLSKEEPGDVDSSPISNAETSEGPSTQASSITDVEDIPTQKVKLHGLDLKPTTPEIEDPPQQAGHDLSHHSSGTETIRVSEEGYETSTTSDKPVGGVLNHATQPFNPTLSEIQVQTKQKFLGTETQPFTVNDRSTATITSPLEQENEGSSDIDNEQAALPQSTSAVGSDRSPKVVTYDSIAKDSLKERAVSPSASAQEQDLSPKQNVQALDATALEDSQVLSTKPMQTQPSMPTEFITPSDEVTTPEVPLPVVNQDGKVSLKPSQAPASAKTETEPPLPPVGKAEKPRFKPQQPSRVTASSTEVSLPAFSGEGQGSIEQAEDLPPAASVAQVPLTDEPELSPPSIETKRQSQASDGTATQPLSSVTVHEPQSERSVRRQGVINPIERMSSAEQSDEQFLSDDSFMEELNSATVQEAKPVSVSKSPIKPFFPRSESQQRIVDTRTSRSVSSPMNQPRNNEETSPSRRPPTATSIRSFSASHAPLPDDQPPPMPKKIGVSSGISQRIKALEQSRQTNRPTSPQSQTTPPNPSTFVNLRKNAQQSPSSASTLNRNVSTQNRPSTAYPSPSPSPDYIKSNPFSQSKKTSAARPESVSVTATIVRDARNKSPEMPVNPSEPRAMDLHQSPLVVEHQKMKPPPPPLSPLKPPRPRYARYSSARSGSSSSTDQTQKTEKLPNSRRDSFASIRSKSSRAGSEPELLRSISDSSLGSAGSPDGSKDDKKDSKRNRLLKRMSSISSMSRRSIAHALSPGPKDGPILEIQEPVVDVPPVSSSVEVGDVNVQFPDTLVSFQSLSIRKFR